MPNHVTNKIEFYGEKQNIEKVLNIINGEDSCIDFEKIIPMPENIFRGNLGQTEREKYGKDNWYDWSIGNWGTKWNAYSSYIDKETNTIIFDTAWSAPIPIFDALAKLCYEYKVSFSGKWADEDMGHNIGVFESDCESDEYWFSYEHLDDCSNEAYEVYVELNGETHCLGKDNHGNWFAHNCDNCPYADEC